MKSLDGRDRELLVGILTVYVGLIGLALFVGLAWRVLRWAGGF